MRSRGIAGSLGKSISKFLRNHKIDFQSGFTSLLSHQQWRSVSLSPQSVQYFPSPSVLILAILIGIKDVSQPFKIPLLKSLCLALLHFLIRLFCSLESNFLSIFLYTFRYKASIRWRVGKDLFAFCAFPFSPIDKVLCLPEAF